MRIRWTASAMGDLTNLCDYIVDQGRPETARRVALRIVDTVESLGELPLRGRHGRKGGTRELVIAGLPFVAVYRLVDGAIEVLRILHGAQRWP